MTKFEFYRRYTNPPPKVETVLDTDTVFVSQSECQTSSLSYQLARYGMDSLTARMDEMRSKFGYADTTGKDFMSLQNKYIQSLEYFRNLPSEVRRKYKDSPEVFYNSLVNDPDSAYKHGFISDDLYKQYKDSRESVNVDDVKTDGSSQSSNSEPSDGVSL